jgi:hypothetical protein
MDSMFDRFCLSGLVCALALTAITGQRAVAGPTFTTFDVPGSMYTLGISINDEGTVTGWYADSNGFDHGFVRATDGTITSFDPPGSSYTNPSAINAGGVITGNYIAENGEGHGFVRAGDGTITTFDPPGSNFTGPAGINSAGAITGIYSDSVNDTFHGFVRAADRTIISFDVPGANSTTAMAINGNGAITGTYNTGSGNYGFLRAPDGAISTIQLRQLSRFVFPLSINDKGTICGYLGNFEEAFVRAPNGHIETFDPSLNPARYGHAEANGVNDKDEVIGIYWKLRGAVHSFVLAHDGRFARFEVPGSTRTRAQSINNLGQITGFYDVGSGVEHGYVRTP